MVMPNPIHGIIEIVGAPLAGAHFAFVEDREGKTMRLIPLLITCHLIFVVTWFSGLFYLPRLFVYHAMSDDEKSQGYFNIMARKLYYGITWPSAVLATGFGLGLLSLNWPYYLSAGWMQLKLLMVLGLWAYHLLCGKYMRDFQQHCNRHSHRFYRWFNEIPVIFLVLIVTLVIFKPTG